MPHQRRASALGCRGRSPLAHQNQADTDGRAGQRHRREGHIIQEDAAKTIAPDLELGRQPVSNDNVSDGRVEGVAAA